MLNPIKYFLSSLPIDNIVIGLIVTIIISTLILLYNKISSWWKSIKRRARTEFYSENNGNNDDVIILDSGVPRFNIDENSIIETETKFLLRFPLKELKKCEGNYIEMFLKKLGTPDNPQKNTDDAQKFYTDKDIIFDDKDMKWLAKTTDINDLADRIEVARMTVAKEFANTSLGNNFNSRTIGLRKYASDRTGTTERPKLALWAYRTDYFTHKVMQNVIHDLLSETIVKIDEIEKEPDLLYKRYFPFLAAIGLNVFILDEDGERLHLCKRSSRVYNGNDNQDADKFHVTMNEGFTATDYDDRTQGGGNITIKNCFRRGMKEELGVSPDELGEINVYMLFFSKSLFQVGLFAWALYKGEKELKDLPAQDKIWETGGEMKDIDFNNNGIQKLLKEEKFTCYSRTGLEYLCQLKNIKLVSEKFNVQYCLYFLKVALGITGR